MTYPGKESSKTGDSKNNSIVIDTVDWLAFVSPSMDFVLSVLLEDRFTRRETHWETP